MVDWVVWRRSGLTTRLKLYVRLVMPEAPMLLNMPPSWKTLYTLTWAVTVALVVKWVFMAAVKLLGISMNSVRLN